MSPAMALFRAVAADPRALGGLLIAVVTAELASTTVLTGSYALVHGTTTRATVGANPAETVIELTLLGTITSTAFAARSFGAALLPEVRVLRALGVAETSFARFGFLMTAGALITGTGLTVAIGGWVTDRWADEFGDLIGVVPEVAHPVWIAPAVAAVQSVSALIGWRSGIRNELRKRGRTALRGSVAAAVAVLITGPTVVVVANAGAFLRLVRSQGDPAAAQRLDVLGSSTAPAVVLSAASLGIVVSAMIVAADLAAGMLGIARNGTRSGLLSILVGIRVAASGIERSGPLVTVVVGTVGLIITRAMTQSAAAGTMSGHAAARIDELRLTLGPVLLTAVACAIGISLAQSRGTGGDVARLVRVGSRTVTALTALLVAAVVIGTSGVVIAVAASASAAAVGVVTGASINPVEVLNDPAVVTATLVAILATGTLFILSEALGIVVDRAQSKRIAKR